MEAQKQVKVIATGVGYHGTQVRNPNDEFYVEAALLEKHPRYRFDEFGQVVIDTDKDSPNKDKPKVFGYYDPPTWFKAVEEVKPGKKGGSNADGLT